MNLDVPVAGILRGVDSGFFRGVMDTSFAAGLDALEITLNTEEALRIVSRHRPAVPRGKLLGMGTICAIARNVAWFTAMCPTGNDSTS